MATGCLTFPGNNAAIYFSSLLPVLKLASICFLYIFCPRLDNYELLKRSLILVCSFRNITDWAILFSTGLTVSLSAHFEESKKCISTPTKTSCSQSRQRVRSI